MIGRLRQAGRRRGALLWALALLFGLAPALCMGFATPAAAFVKTIVHAHDHGGAPHSHHHHHHDHADVGNADIDAPGSEHGNSDHGDQDRAHVHYDASCPSVIVPAPTILVVEQHFGMVLAQPPEKALHGSSPTRLLRPPISQSRL